MIRTRFPESFTSERDADEHRNRRQVCVTPDAYCARLGEHTQTAQSEPQASAAGEAELTVGTLGATRFEVLAAAVVHYLLLAVFAAILATPVGIALAWILTRVLLEVDFAIDGLDLAVVNLGAIALTGLLGATTILRALSRRPALLLRELGAD